MLSILIATGMSARPGPLSGQNQKVCVCVCRPRHAYTFTTIFHFYIYLCKMKTMSSHQYFSFQSNSPFTPLRVWNLAPIIRIYLLFDQSPLYITNLPPPLPLLPHVDTPLSLLGLSLPMLSHPSSACSDSDLPWEMTAPRSCRHASYAAPFHGCGTELFRKERGLTDF